MASAQLKSRGRPRRRPLRRAALLAAPLLALLAAGAARAELLDIWAVDDGTKVRGDALEHPLRAGNGIFWRRGQRVRLFGLRNETIAFQLILCGGTAPTPGLRVRFDSLGSIRNGEVSDDPDRYLLDRRIELFEEHYLRITRPTGDQMPEGVGLVPDPLIPLRRALTVPARSVRAVWVDIYIPRDAPAGLHHGVLTVEQDGKPCTVPGCRLEVTLEILPMALPERPAARTMLWFSGSANDRQNMAARYFPGGTPRDPQQLVLLRRRHYQLARRHRVTLFADVDGGRDEELGALFSGQAFSRAAGYYGPGEGVPQDMYSIHTYGSGPLSSIEAQAWSDWFGAHAPTVEYFLYTHDEPHDPALFAGINAKARGARPVPSFVTARPQPGLEVDIYAVAPSEYSVDEARRATAAGKRVWIYNGHRPRTGTFFTDDSAVAMRVNPWLQWRYQIPRWFYWESTYYVDGQGGRGPVNVYRDAMTFSNRYGDRLNGDGVLFYPGRDLLFPEEDRGLDLPLPSLRLKSWRRGLQDVDYLELARRAGLGDFASNVAARLVPRALDEVSSDEPPSWPEDGERWLEARRLLFQALKTGRAPAADLRPLMRPAETCSAWAKRVARRWTRGKLRRAVLLGGFACVIVAAVWLSRRRRHA